jgi:hypothetical protein
LRLQFLKSSVKIYSFIIGIRAILKNGNPVFIFRNMSAGQRGLLLETKEQETKGRGLAGWENTQTFSQK